jgi:hypothetical protein
MFQFIQGGIDAISTAAMRATISRAFATDGRVALVRETDPANYDVVIAALMLDEVHVPADVEISIEPLENEAIEAVEGLTI